MDLPDEKGTYVLIASVPQMKRIEIGRLGRFDIIPGYYAYVGSAFGSGGLRAHLGHHFGGFNNSWWGSSKTDPQAFAVFHDSPRLIRTSVDPAFQNLAGSLPSVGREKQLKSEHLAGP